MNLKNLVKSYSFWTALAGALVILINSIGNIFGFQIEEKLVSDIVMAIAGVLVAFGVVTLPSSTKGNPQQQETETNEDPAQNEQQEDEQSDDKQNPSV